MAANRRDPVRACAYHVPPVDARTQKGDKLLKLEAKGGGGIKTTTKP